MVGYAEFMFVLSVVHLGLLIFENYFESTTFHTIFMLFDKEAVRPLVMGEHHAFCFLPGILNDLLAFI